MYTAFVRPPHTIFSGSRRIKIFFARRRCISASSKVITRQYAHIARITAPVSVRTSSRLIAPAAKERIIISRINTPIVQG